MLGGALWEHLLPNDVGLARFQAPCKIGPISSSVRVAEMSALSLRCWRLSESEACRVGRGAGVQGALGAGKGARGTSKNVGGALHIK